MEKSVIDIHRTVFVGGLPRIVTAEEIADMFSEFGKVLLVTIDIDQDYGYPKVSHYLYYDKIHSTIFQGSSSGNVQTGYVVQ